MPVRVLSRRNWDTETGVGAHPGPQRCLPGHREQAGHPGPAGLRPPPSRPGAVGLRAERPRAQASGDKCAPPPGPTTAVCVRVCARELAAARGPWCGRGEGAQRGGGSVGVWRRERGGVADSGRTVVRTGHNPWGPGQKERADPVQTLFRVSGQQPQSKKQARGPV